MTKRHILLEGLESTPSDILRLVRRNNAPDADWRPSEELASTRDVVLQLIANDYEIQYVVAKATRRSNGVVPPDIPLEQRTPEDMPLVDMVEVFAEIRRSTIETLTTLSPGDWQRVVERKSGSPVSIRFVVQDLVERDIALTDQLIRTSQAWLRK